MEPEQDELADYPTVVREFIEFSWGQGVEFSQDTLDQLLGEGQPARPLVSPSEEGPELDAQAGRRPAKGVTWGFTLSQGTSGQGSQRRLRFRRVRCLLMGTGISLPLSVRYFVRMLFLRPSGLSLRSLAI